MDQRYFEESETTQGAAASVDGSRTAIVSAFAVGFVVGATLTLLWAPASGKKTRRWIQEHSRSARQHSVELFERQWRALRILPKRGILGLIRRARVPAV